jgi:hypothetical protein
MRVSKAFEFRMLMFWEVMLCRLMVIDVQMDGNNAVFRVKQSEKDWTP